MDTKSPQHFIKCMKVIPKRLETCLAGLVSWKPHTKRSFEVRAHSTAPLWNQCISLLCTIPTLKTSSVSSIEIFMESPPIDSLAFQETQSTENQPSPSRRPSSLNWTLDGLLSIGANFVPVARVSASLPPDKLTDIISHHEHKGLPLVIEGWHLNKGWDPELLSPDWLARKFPEREDAQSQSLIIIC